MMYNFAGVNRSMAIPLQMRVRRALWAMVGYWGLNSVFLPV